MHRSEAGFDDTAKLAHPLMTSDNPLTPEEEAVFNRAADQVRHNSVRQLADNRTGEFTIAFVGQLQGEIDRIAQLVGTQGVAFACRAGCSHCCHARVTVLPPEVFRIAHALQSRPPQALEALTERMRAHVARAGEAANWQDRPLCPFLEDDLCSIYPVRPGACRKAHSLDAAVCASYAAEIPHSLKMLAGAEALMKGTAEAYAEVGLQVARVELVGAVLQALDDASAEARWCSGDDVFGQPGD